MQTGEENDDLIITVFEILEQELKSFAIPLLDDGKQKKYFFKYKQPKTPRRSKSKHHSPRKPLNIEEMITFFNCYEYTGLYPRIVFKIVEICSDKIVLPRVNNIIELNRKANSKRKPRKTINTPLERMLMVLYWIRFGCSLKEMGITFRVSKSFVFREIHHILPILVEKVNVISKFGNEFLAMFPIPIDNKGEIFSVHGALDCSTHRRDRIHPGQNKLYRGDKKCHFIGSQVITHLSGMFTSVDLALGHNNDSGVWNRSLKSSFPPSLKLLVDDGYTNRVSTVRANFFASEELQQTQRTLRSVVEVAIGNVKTFGVSRKRCKILPEYQEMALLVCHNFTQLKLMISPLRPKYLPPKVLKLLRDNVLNVLIISKADFHLVLNKK